MKHILITTIAAVMLVGCGNPEADKALINDVIAGDIISVRQDLANGADVNAKYGGGETSLHEAARYGHKGTVELLIAKGADVDAKNSHGKTPLHYAVTKEIAELLIAKGTDVDAKDVLMGMTPLHYAAWGGRNEIAELLIAKGADVNAKESTGENPLHLATTKEIAELLIAKGADLNAKNDDGFTPLDYAKTVYEDDGPECKAAKKEIADLLRKHGGKTAEELKAEGK
jgi:ankyrin repeat protein